jgi:hypothetical protein
MLFESPMDSTADQVYPLERQLPTSEQLPVVETVLNGIDVMSRTVISFLGDQKQDARISAAAAYRASVAVLQQLGSLWN